MSHVFHILLSRIVSVVLAIVNVTILIVSPFEGEDLRHDSMTNTKNQSLSQEFDDELEISETQ